MNHLETKLGWFDIDFILGQLTNKIRASKQEYDLIAGITRGGLVPAVMLSHKLNTPMMAMSPLDVLPADKRILVVDEIYDTGKTLDKVQELNPHVDIAVLIHNTDKPLMFFGIKNDTQRWIVFPWENDNEEASKTRSNNT